MVWHQYWTILRGFFLLQLKNPTFVTNTITWTHINKMLPVDVLAPSKSEDASCGHATLTAAGFLKYVTCSAKWRRQKSHGEAQIIARLDRKSSLGNFASVRPVLLPIILVISYMCLCFHMASSKERFGPEHVPYFPVSLPRPYLSCVHTSFCSV